MTVFWILGGIGIVLLILALTVGEVLDGMLGLDSFNILDSDVVSTAGVAGLMGGFGFAGAVATSLSDSVGVGVVVGVLVGALLAWGAGRLTRLLRSQANEVTHSTESLIGAEGQVITDIPSEGYGQVRISSAGSQHVLNARCPIELNSGSRIWVSGVLSATAVEVRPVTEC
ncbi:hypothetical protein HMPREF1531_02264 [Propionibacterium sp. oral taxon 192 str. F0372]|uniref:NfeD family protein n=1 Tax=Propionibacterium sp. oral taxon 192 TaxID=671222 RepID=UPI000353A6B8|nr:NfeD family protein [Propionibacterium sp. oral taxon 192]EPH02946.1 hypothetical protein HMPREF1531_02264 [Propionibacterium sp. oral taxon 192 str. F0372]